MARITYVPEAAVEEDDLDQSLLEVSIKHGIPLTHVCGGNARCSTCRVLVLENPANFCPRNEKEQELADRRGFQPCVRLACQTHVIGDVTVRPLVIDTRDRALVDIEDQQAIGREANVAVLFSDIRNFTPFAERNLPYDVIHILNRYFQTHGEAVVANGGYIDKYMGDGMMAVFGLDGDDAEAACVAALRAAEAMVAALGPINEYVGRFFGETFHIGIGVHYGPAVVGQIGYPGKRQFTAIGDTVNTASRIESATKECGVTVLVSEAVVKAVGDLLGAGRTFDVRLKGKMEPMQLREFVGFAGQ